MANFYGRILFFNHLMVPPTVYKISGQVTIGGSGQSGAIVDCIDDTLQTLVGSKTTDGSGNYSFDSGMAINGNNKYHVAAEYDSGSQKYNGKSQPYVSPVVNP